MIIKKQNDVAEVRNHTLYPYHRANLLEDQKKNFIPEKNHLLKHSFRPLQIQGYFFNQRGEAYSFSNSFFPDKKKGDSCAFASVLTSLFAYDISDDYQSE